MALSPVAATPLNFPYTAIDLSMAVNVLPNVYGLIRSLGVFGAPAPLTTTYVRVDRINGQLRVLPAVERGGPPTEASRAGSEALFLQIPHFPFEDTLKPEDLQDLLEPRGNVLVPASQEAALAQRLRDVRNYHDILLEYLRAMALSGKIKDGAGVTLHDLYAHFGITQKKVYFDLATEASDIDGHCAEVFEHITENLQGEVMDGVTVLCDPAFFSALVAHGAVREAYLGWQAATQISNPLRVEAGGQFGRVFPYGNLVFREYIGAVTLADGSTTAKLIGADVARAFPTGTMTTFETPYAPPHDMAFVNQRGPEIYISPKVLDHGQGVELLSQSNYLPLVKRPELVVELHKGADPG